MRDYINIVTKIQNTPWLITPEGLKVVLAIVEERLNNGKLSDEELAIRLQGNVGLVDNESNHKNQSGNGIGVLSLEGPLFGKANLMTALSGATSLETFKSDFMTMVNDGNIGHILLDIDSPGGTSEMVKEVGRLIYDARQEKPIWAISNSTAGSAAYWLMSQADHLYANHGSFVGSIGAYTVHEDNSAADAQQGKKFTFISAGKYKTEGNEHEPLSAEAREYRQEVIDELYSDFVDSVATGRGITPEMVEQNFGQGRMLTETAALGRGMVDGIMTFDELINHISAQPRAVTVSFNGIPSESTTTAASVNESGVVSNYMQWQGNTATGFLQGSTVMVNLESKEMEHSEPGTGTPPAPRKDEDGSDDIAIRQGWRRDDLPVYGPDAPQPNDPGSNIVRGEVNGLTPEELEGIRITLGCSEDEFYMSLRTAVEGWRDVQASLASATEDERLKREFPQMWQQHQDLLAADRANKAREFGESIKTFAAMNGTQLRPTNHGLSALALETVVQTHMKFAEGSVTQEDFERCINTITQGGMVEYGERGSSRVANTEQLGAVNINSAEGIKTMRQQFFAIVQEIQAQDSLDMKAAVAEAARRHPDLARAYQTANPLNSPTGA